MLKKGGEERNMKKLIVIAIAATMILGISALAHADTVATDKDIAISFDVTDLFGMEIWDDEYSQVLDDVDPGGSAMGDVHIYATSNHGIPWYINGQSTGMIGSLQVLPVLVSTFDGITGGPDEGTVQAPIGTFVTDLKLANTPTAIYTAASSEYTVRGLQIGCFLLIPTTIDTMTDTYAGTVVLTMTE